MRAVQQLAKLAAGTGCGPQPRRCLSLQLAPPVAEALRAGAGCSLQPRRCLSLKLAPPVAEALRAGDPVVALESTIITHGMPYPQNLQTALMVEDTIRQQGAVPATVGIIAGQLHVGLSRELIERLASRHHPCVKTSRRDLAPVMAKGLDGGTTVSGTLVAAARVGISVFVTGGIGGVHRGGELSMDVSADITELGRSPVCCVCAGVKSILDIGRTLEALETHGVSVVTLGESDRFPAFFTPDSGFPSPHHVTTCEEAAALLYQHRLLGLESGVLLAVPIPEQHRAHGDIVQVAIDQALSEADIGNITGRDVTPFILSRVNELTGGASLAANVRLIENNAIHGGRVAVALARRTALSRGESEKGSRVLNIPADFTETATVDSATADGSGSREQTPAGSETAQPTGHGTPCVSRGEAPAGSETAQPTGHGTPCVSRGETPAGSETAQPTGHGTPCVIGGSVVDFIVQVTEAEIRRDGSTHQGRIAQGHGGVARNVADALSRLGHRPRFISAVGRDRLGDALLSANAHMDWGCVARPVTAPTATYVLMTDAAGAVQFGVGDMNVHQSITPQLVDDQAAVLSRSPLVLVDANTPRITLSRAAQLCAQSAVPLWFEPTDLLKAAKVSALVTQPKPLMYTSPNAAELRTIAQTLTQESLEDPRGLRGQPLVEWCRDTSLRLLEHFHCLVVTMGVHGIMVTRRGLRSDPLPMGPLPDTEGDTRRRSADVSCVHYAVTPAPNVVTESGAGDCFNAGFISGLLSAVDQDRCVWRGQQAALQALLVTGAVPCSLYLPSADNQSP